MTTPGDIKFTGQKFNISNALKDHTINGINKDILDNYKKWITGGIDVIMKKDSDHNHIAEINVHVHDAVLNATASYPDMYAAIDKMIEKMEAQLKKYKGKHLGHQQ
jgi:putative sigma-54 modulation protein